MKTKFLGSVLTAATLFLTALPAAEKSPESTPRRADAATRFDTDGDGQLSANERQAAREARAAERPRQAARKLRAELRERRQEFDRDGDGRLNDEEFAAFDAANRAAFEQRPRAMQRFDQDGDGRLSDEEWAKARQAWRERMKKERAGPSDRRRDRR